MTAEQPLVRAFSMQLNPGQAKAYKQRHDQIWPELKQSLLDAGVLDFRIYLDPTTHVLFAHLTATPDNRVAQMRDQAVMWEWWRMMADIMEVEADSSPREQDLLPMFALTAARRND